MITQRKNGFMSAMGCRLSFSTFMRIQSIRTQPARVPRGPGVDVTGPRYLALATLLLVCTDVVGCGTEAAPHALPVPAIVLRADMTEPVRGRVMVEAELTDFAAERVEFFVGVPDGGGQTAVHVDTQSPFTWEIDTTTVPDGPYLVYAIAFDGDERLVGALSLQIRNRPNIVFVFLDDLDDMQTPFLDAMPNTLELIADRGLRFANSFAPAPACAPARAMTLSGRYPHNNGVFDLNPPDGGLTTFRNTYEGDNLATRLHDAGYRTAYLGKYFNDYVFYTPYVPPGWDEWFGMRTNMYASGDYDASHNGVTVSFGSSPEEYQTDVLTDLGVDFIESTETGDDQPFLLFVSPPGPHLPLTPAPRHADHAWVASAPDPRPNFDEADVSDKPLWMRDGLPPLGAFSLAFNELDHQNRMGCLMSLDDMIGRLVDALERHGELDQTVFFFTSDNGYNLGVHRRLGKSLPYEESVRVPLLVAGRDVAVGTEAAMVAQIDFAPTMLDLAGVPHDDLDGRSLVPLLTGDQTSWREELLFELNGTYRSGHLHTYDDIVTELAEPEPAMRTPTYRALRTEEMLYVQWYAGDVHEYELYELATDPYQLDNLLATPAGQMAWLAVTTDLQARLNAQTACSGSSCR